MDNELFKKNIFRLCDGDRETTRNVLDISPGQRILVRRGLNEVEMEFLVSMISQLTTKRKLVK